MAQAIQKQRPATNFDYSKLVDIINKNKEIPFVNRFINSQDYPVINNPDGTYSTHKMMWGESRGKYYVFPSIEMIEDQLTDLPSVGINPFKHAMENKNYIEFNSPEEASWFSKNYKKYWDIFP